MREPRGDNGSAGEPGAAPEGAPALSVDNLRAYYLMHYFGVEREVRAVDGISLIVRGNEIYGLAGESSCGKTTFLKTIAAAVRPPLTVIGGSVRYGFLDRDIYALSPAELSAVRWKHLSYITQGSMNVLNPVRRVRQSFIDFAYRHMNLKRRAFFAAVEQHLQRLHLAANVLDAYPHELSGGMKQRVTIALATICRPEFIIADEPTTALDVIVQKDVLAMIREAQQQIGSSMLFVTHDMTVHANITDRLGIMYAGRLVEEAPTAEIFTKPMHPYTAHLVASLPRIGEQSRKEALSGTPPNLANPPSGCRFHPRCPLAMDVCRAASPVLTTLAPSHRVACYAASPLVKPSSTVERAASVRSRAEPAGLVQ
jgi:peptide/nickel transport system ATP-binding protein